MAAHEYWRINVSANDGDASFLALAEVEMRATLGGADQCTGGTATASSTHSTSSPANAVDNNSSTHWITDTGVLTGWWQYQFAAPVEVNEYFIRAHSSNPDTAPRSWALEYSDDGIAWTVADTRTGVTIWRSGGIGIYVVSQGSGSGPFNRWILDLTVNSGNTTAFPLSIAEIEMRATVGGADQITGGTASASESSISPALAADNDPSTSWSTSNSHISAWWQYDFGASTAIAEYTIQSHPSTPDRSPSAWRLLGSDDGVSWFTADEQSAQTGWTNGEIREFTLNGATAGEIRVTQQATLVLSAADSDVRVTQAAVLALVFMPDAAEEIRVTQAAVLALAEFDAEIRITQSAVLVLADQVNCLTKWAQTWTITRVDGEVRAFTSHDMAVMFRGVTHTPCNSLMATAVELSTAMGTSGSQDLMGLLSDVGVSEEDIYNGLYDGATIESWMVPWDNAGGEIPFRIMGGVIGSAGFGELTFNQEVLSDSARLGQTALLETYTPGCRYLFGSVNDSRCPVDLSALQVSGSVTGTAIPNASTSSTRRIFTDSTRAEADGFFDFGVITWTSGANAGATSEVKDFAAGQFIIWDVLLFPIQLGDTYTATPGCDKSTADHLVFNADLVDFGGFPDVPGNDSLLQSPDAKG